MGLTRREVAERSGIGLGVIRDLEQGRTGRPRGAAAQRLAQVLGLDHVVLAITAPSPGQRRKERRDVRLAVLGPLAAWRSSTAVDLGSERQRAVLALLAINAHRLVHREELIDAIWGEAPPSSAVAMVQSYVSQLRDALAASADGPTHRHDLLVTVGASYLLRPGPRQLDMSLFTVMAARARDQAAAGQAAAACEIYEQALGLWRGEPVADVELLRGHPAVAKLGRQRTAVALEFAQAAAEAGNHGRTLEQLRAIARTEPLDERVHARLMAALAATGQQAAALRVFEQVRTRLDHELGVSPGPELADAHLQIMRATDEDGAGSVQALSGVLAAVLPRQLPSAVRHFAGRATELKALWEMLEQAGTRPGAVVISAIGGMAGVGKTALAVHWAQEAAHRFPDGQLFADLAGFGPSAPTEPARVIGWFLGSLGVPVNQVPADRQAQAALLRSVLADKRVLILLDNARDADQVRPLLPGSPGCLVLVTSRAWLTGLAVTDGAAILDVDVPDPAQARELLAQRVGQDRLAAEPGAADELVQLCGRLPLALAITAARVGTRPGSSLADMVRELRDESGRLQALDADQDAAGIRQVFSWSYRQLTSPAATMFRLLAVHPGPDVTVPAAASLAGVTRTEARRALAELTGAHLLTETQVGRWASHDLIRAYAVELATAADPQADRRAALGRVLDHYLHTSHHAALLLSPPRLPIPLDPAQPGVRPEHLADCGQGLDWFDAEHRVLLTAITQAADNGFDAHAWQLPWAMTDFLGWRGHWHEQATAQRTALAAATRLADTAAQATTCRLLATTCARLGDYDQARSHLTRCLGLCRQRGDRAAEARAQRDLSWVAQCQRRHEDALAHAEQALALIQPSTDQIGHAGALNNVGWCHALTGNPTRARRFCCQSLTLYQQLGDRYGEAQTWDSLGYINHQLGRLAYATACYERALATFWELGDRYDEAVSLGRLGDTYHTAGKPSRARDAWQHAVAILDDLRHPDAEQIRAKLST
jgi:DNA-binding SARP family transcriptional activator